MYGGALKSRAGSWTRGLRPASARVGVSVTAVAILAAAFVAGGRRPSREVLATAPVPAAPSVAAPTTARSTSRPERAGRAQPRLTVAAGLRSAPPPGPAASRRSP